MMAIAEHPVVYIGASVALQIIQGVPDRRTAGRRQVDVGIENDLLISRCHCTDGPAIGSGNQRTAQVARILFLANAVGRGNKQSRPSGILKGLN